MQEILDFLKAKYDPIAMIVYGSYANNTNTETSDFDALLIAKENIEAHDTSIIYGTKLDIFVYSETYFEEEFSPEDFLQIEDGKILFDTNGVAAKLKKNVISYIESIPPKTNEEINNELAWCRKMLDRAQNTDAEGLYRKHWLLIDSLEIACDILGYRYRGPKKSLAWLNREHRVLYETYTQALERNDLPTIKAWIDAVENATLQEKKQST